MTKYVEVTPETTELDVESTQDVIATNVHEPCVQEQEPAVDVVKQEYAVVGDSLFATVDGDVPYWLSVLIDNAVDTSIASGLSDYNDLRQDVHNAIDSIDVARNTFVEQIILDQTIDEAISARLTTLDATYQDQFATKVELTTAVANRESAVAQDISDLSVSFNNTIDSRITNVETAFANADSTLANSIDSLTSTIESQNGDVTANATALRGLRTYVGVDETNTPDGTGLTSRVDSHSEAFTNLENQVTGPAGDTAYALSNLEQRSAAYSDDAATGVESKFAYDSILNINGQYYKAGFGLTATGLTQTAAGTEVDPFDSRFWVNADQFILSDSLGATAPVFTVDTVSRDVIFNGKVTFNSGGSQQVGTIDQAITASVDQVAVGDKNINITDNLIPTTSLISDTNNAGYQLIGNPVKSTAAGLASFAEPQFTLDGNDEVYSPYVDDLVYAYYYRFGIKGITNLTPFKIATLTAADAVTYGTVVTQLDAGESLSATEWYIIDGIINPTGGSNEFAGSIRKADGTKIGDIRNYVVPADADKLVLGWQYGVTVSRPKLSRITADTITGNTATTDYVAEQIAGVSTDYASLDGKDLLAQELGYADYAGMVAAATAGSTVINGGYINTNLFKADGGYITNAMIGNIIQSDPFITNTTGWRVDKAGTAEFNSLKARGVSIYDDSGNLLLGSGSGLAWGAVSGAGKPADNADRTADNIAAGIAGQGNFATLDQITAANASTYIASAAIGNAYIGNAAVNTLQLAGQAVTIPVSAYTAGVYNLVNNSWQTIQSASITNSNSAPVNIFASFLLSGVVDDGPYDVDGKYEVRLLRGSTTIYSTGEINGAADGRAMCAFSVKDSPGNGAKSYSLQVRDKNSGYNDEGAAYNRSLVLLGVKR